MGKHTELGKNGEILAVDFLQKKGHIILFTNYRKMHKEVDIVSLDGDILVFTEIKTRSHYQFGFPEEAVGARKQSHLKSAAELFLADYAQYEKVRFDIISILLQRDVIKEIIHFEDAFY